MKIAGNNSRICTLITIAPSSSISYVVFLYVKFPDATWVEDEKLGPGVGILKPKYTVWALDKQWNVKIERHGFFIASDFSGTAHSFQGANLNAAIADCGPWHSNDNRPTKKDISDIR